MRNRKTLFSSLFIALFLCTIPQIFAANLYVSNASGNDAFGGTSWGDAKKTIMAAVTAASSGDNILIEGGTYQEQVVFGNKSLTVTGSLNSGGTRTVINAPAWADITSYTLASDLTWNGSGKLSSTTIKPIVFVNATSDAWTINIKGIDINGTTAGMAEASPEVFVGLAHRWALGTIGGSGVNYIEVKNIKPTDANTVASNNTAGILFLTRSKPTLEYARVHNYRNIGIGVIGYSFANTSSIIADQPYPTIQDCIVTGENGGTTDNSENSIQTGILVTNGAQALIRRSHIHGNRSQNALAGRYAYGIFLNDARTVLIGDNSTKANGNVISDNEIALYVKVNTSSLSASLYTVKFNNIVYNGGTAANMGTPSGKIANYTNPIAQHTTSGVIRFNHFSGSSQSLIVAQNAFGNSESNLFYSYSAAPYTITQYDNAPVAFWRESVGDVITYTTPLSAPVSTNLSVNSTHNGSTTSGEPQVDVAYGYTKFDQLNRAVYAAAILSVGTVPPRIDLESDVVENESVIITKPIKIFGSTSHNSGNNCNLHRSITLRNGLNEPTLWFYGLTTGIGNLDALNRQPRRDTLQRLRILANVEQAASTDSTSAPAVLFTGTTFGSNAPITPVLSFMSISSEFGGGNGNVNPSPAAYSTSQTGTSSYSGKRYAPFAAGPYSVKYTRRPENCSTLVADPNVVDYSDNNDLAQFRFDNNIYVANCVELNAAIAAAEGPDATSIIVTENILTLCDAFVNNTETIIMDVVAGKTANIHYLLNPGTAPTYGGSSRAICDFTIAPPLSSLGGTHNVPRVTTYPPACLQKAIDLVSPGANNVLVAANGSVSNIRPFLDASPVTINKIFDFMGATYQTAHQVSPSAGNATYAGKFQLNAGADIQNTGGSLTSTLGTTFGGSEQQVELTFSNNALTNFTGGTGDAIEMALQLVNNSSGSRRLQLTKTDGDYSGETPTINKRVHIEGLANRGSVVGTLTLSGSGDCTNPSVLRNLELANVIVNSDADCIQTALGIADCSTYTQDLEGVGTSSVDGSGGTVDLNSETYTQNLAISKSVEFSNAIETSGTVTLRKGATILNNSLDNFTNTVNLEQCSSFSGASNPSPQDGIGIANTGTGIVTIAGYGENDPTAGNGVWNFSNINVNKDIEIRGNYYSTSAANLTCDLLAGNTLPLVNTTIRPANQETVIGTHDVTTLTISNPIFKVTTSGASIKGFKIRNVESAASNAFVRIDGTISNVEVLNNILSGSATSGSVIGLVHDNSGGYKTNISIADNHFTTGNAAYKAIHLNGLDDVTAPNTIFNNVIDGTYITSNAIEVSDISNSASTGLNIYGNWVRCQGTGLQLTSIGANKLNGITVERNNFRESQNGVLINTSTAPGSNGITIRENYINNNFDGVEIFGDLTSITTNQIFINDNNLASNSNGILIPALTSNSAPTTNMLDLRFNWWGSALGPVKGTNVAISPSFAGTDSLTVIGHVPFTHNSASKIEDNAATAYGRWMVYPAATEATDGNPGCGWQFDKMMLSVLRVNSNRSSLIGNYVTITAAAASTVPGGNTSDELFILGRSTYITTSYGYPSASSPEPATPVIFSVAGQPATIKGLTFPTINAGNTSGMIEVTSTFPQGFTVSDYIKHISDATTHTVLSFANNFGNTVKNNYMTSNFASPANYTGIKLTGGIASETHSIQNNRINLTDGTPGTSGEAWPGSSTVTTTASIPTNAFKAVQVTGNATLSPLNITCNDFVAASTSNSTGIEYTSSLTATETVTIDANTISTMGKGVHVTLTPPVGTFTTRDIRTTGNFIIDGTTGVQINGSLESMTTNRLFVNNNNLDGNTNGVDIQATTSNTAVSANMLDLRFNWWGSNLGPVKGATIATAPSFAGSDSLNIIGHIPFTHTSGAKIEDVNGVSHGRWMIYPAATVITDQNGLSCGWNYSHIMPAVLRVNAAGNTLLGAYSTITQGRDGTTSAFGITDGARNTTDELFILGPSSYGVATFGYPSTAGHETYPVTFNAAGQPSTIKGLTYPTINTGGTAQQTIFVDETFPAGFSILDYIKYISSAATHTVLVFKNNTGNTVKNNYMTSNNATPTLYKGIEILRGLAGQTHTIQDNKINLTDGNTGEAWPGSANITTTASTPSTFIGIRYVCSTAANLNVTCNDIIANSTTGSTGIEYCSDVAPSGTVNIEANNIRSMGSGIHYTFNAGYGFTNNVTTKENFIVNGVRGILLNGNLAPMITNRVFVNNNNLSGNTTAGIDINATTSRTVATTNMLDLRFNWWGSNLGPQIGSGVSNAPDFAGTDSLNIIGHVPFTHATGSSIVDVNGSTHGRWMVYPAATVSTDANGVSCGWNYTHIMPAVLRVNAAANTLLGAHNTIAAARDAAASIAGITTGARDITDQLYILGFSTYGSDEFGYRANTVDPTNKPIANGEVFPVEFVDTPEPSTIKGLTYPAIRVGNTDGAFEIKSSYPAGFTIKDYIRHFYEDIADFTVLSFSNAHGNTVENNFMASNGTPSSYVGISMTAGAASKTHTIQYNRINLSNGTKGEAWPGSSNNTTELYTTGISDPAVFKGISLTGTAGESPINVICNNIVLSASSGSLSKGIEFTSNASTSGAVNIEANVISNMASGTGIHYNFDNVYGFSADIRNHKNRIIEGMEGVKFEGDFANNLTNKVFVNNNDLSGNTSQGIVITTLANIPANVSSDNFMDFRFNWWGSELGPERGASVSSVPYLASNDQVRVAGNIPFDHSGYPVSVMEDQAATGSGRWIIYPVATSSFDANGPACGWQYSTMMGAVLRVNSTSNLVLGTYNNITLAKDAGLNNDEQIFVIAKSTYEGIDFGYDGAANNELSYPVVFNDVGNFEPSILRGINRPRILSNGTGSISVTSAYPTGFTVKDYIEHVGTGLNYTALSFANNHSNNAQNNFITSTNTAPTTFTGITISQSGNDNYQTLDSNRIVLDNDPRWPGGPSAALSAPETFTGISFTSTGTFGLTGSNGIIFKNDIAVGITTGETKSVGIYIDAPNEVVDIKENTISGMGVSASTNLATRTHYWGTGIYVKAPIENFYVNDNTIQGADPTDDGGAKGYDGITIDRPTALANEINTNIISTVQPLSGLDIYNTRPRGYGIKIFNSTTGNDDFGNVSVNGNTLGSSTSTAPQVASIYVGGTNGNISMIDIEANTISNGTASNNASIQIATDQYSGTSTTLSHVIIDNNQIGSTTSGLSNAMFLAIGTDADGITKNTQANNYRVDVKNNSIRTSAQSIASKTIEVADGRPNGGANIRNIFGYGDGITLNGLTTAGNGNSGNNTFTHAAILTGEVGLANYTLQLTRTGNAIAYPANTDPVVISRLIASPLASAISTDSLNTVEIRENAGWTIGNEDLYYKETLTFPDHRILINGPAAATAATPAGSAYAELLPGAGGTGVMFTSVGRENKDIRGSIRFNTIGAGMYGEVPKGTVISGTSYTGAANKGDVYLQMANVAGDNRLLFRHHGTALASLTDITGLDNSLVRATDIKAGMDDADDDSYTANTSTLRRTGVFRSGTSLNQFLKETPNAVAGTELMNVFPNPASGDVTVAFKVPVEGMIRVALYDAMGRKVTDLREEYLTVDTYSTTFNAADLPSGTYHVRLMHDLFTVTTSVTVIK